MGLWNYKVARGLAACAVLLAASQAAAKVVWRGDFETGNRLQYSGAQMVSQDRLEVVGKPTVAEGHFALKVTVRRGDDPINSSGDRAELTYATNENAGDEFFYSWRVKFAKDFPSVPTWQLFTQWHQIADCCGSPPVEFYVYGEEMRLRLTASTTVWSAPLVRDVWHEFVFHVKWSPDPKVGFVELWHNGKQVVTKKPVATMYPGTRNYLKLGLYRADTIDAPGVLYHDGFMMATELKDVIPPAEKTGGATP